MAEENTEPTNTSALSEDTAAPTASEQPEEPIEIDRHLLEQVLDAIRPSLQADGGDMELVSVDDATGTVTLKLSGACNGCPLSSVTLSMGVERILKEHVPGVQHVKDVIEEGGTYGSMLGMAGMGSGGVGYGVPEDQSLI